MDSSLENKPIDVKTSTTLQRRVFKPLILFHDQASSATLDTPARIRRQSLIEEHRIKTKDMLDYNALLWESEGRTYCSTPKPSSSDQSPTVTNQQLTSRVSSNRSSMSYSDIPPSNELIFNNQRQGNNPFFSTSHPNSSAMDILEPSTQTSIPLPLYNTSHDEPYQQQKSVFEAEDCEVDSPIINTTTFIAEPQFHHTYRPNISRKRRRGNLPKEVTGFLKHWLMLHKKHPYPTEREKQMLANETGLMVNQISNWFINARRRILQPLLESESHQILPNEDAIIPSGSNDSYIARSKSSSNGTRHAIDQSSDDGDRPSSHLYPHRHHQDYNHSMQPSQQTQQDPLNFQDTYGHPTEKHDHEPPNSVPTPPPWVPLPTKLPSMNILEKDLDAFKPE